MGDLEDAESVDRRLQKSLRQLEFARRFVEGEKGFSASGEDGLDEAGEGGGQAAANRRLVLHARLRQVDHADALLDRPVVMAVVVVVVVVVAVVVVAPAVGVVVVAAAAVVGMTLKCVIVGVKGGEGGVAADLRRFPRMIQMEIIVAGLLLLLLWLLLLLLRRSQQRGGKSQS